jgi:hypothetical protein
MTQPTGLPLTVPDLVGFDDLDPNASETTSDLQTLFQDVYHVAVEILGTNPDDPTRGVGLLTYLSGTSVQLQTAGGVLENQLLADDRITSCNVAFDFSTVPNTVTINIGVDGQVIGLQYGFTNGVLTPIGQTFIQPGAP